MSALTLRLPDDKHQRLKALARAKSVSLNQLMNELAAQALSRQEARAGFENRAARGDVSRGLSLLDRLDRAG